MKRIFDKYLLCSDSSILEAEREKIRQEELKKINEEKQKAEEIRKKREEELRKVKEKEEQLLQQEVEYRPVKLYMYLQLHEQRIRLNSKYVYVFQKKNYRMQTNIQYLHSIPY